MHKNSPSTALSSTIFLLFRSVLLHLRILEQRIERLRGRVVALRRLNVLERPLDRRLRLRIVRLNLDRPVKLPLDRDDRVRPLQLLERVESLLVLLVLLAGYFILKNRRAAPLPMKASDYSADKLRQAKPPREAPVAAV